MVWEKAWTLSQTTEKMLNAFERRVLRKIYGPMLVHGQLPNKIYKSYQKEVTHTSRTKSGT